MTASCVLALVAVVIGLVCMAILAAASRSREEEQLWSRRIMWGIGAAVAPMIMRLFVLAIAG